MQDILERLGWIDAFTHFGGEDGREAKSWCPKRNQMKDIFDWTGMDRYVVVKRNAEDGKRWKLMVVNLRFEEDK